MVGSSGEDDEGQNQEYVAPVDGQVLGVWGSGRMPGPLLIFMEQITLKLFPRF